VSIDDVDSFAAQAVGNHCADTIDELVQDVFVTGTQVIRPNGRAATANVTSTDYLNATTVRKAVTKLKCQQGPRLRWVLRGWRAPARHPRPARGDRLGFVASAERVRREPEQHLDRRVGLFEGVRFVQNTRTRKATDGATSATVYRTFVLGQQAIAERAVEQPHTVLSPQVDKLKRFNTLGWYAFIGWCLYRDESIVRLESSSSMVGV
jgi:hypothetical protein